MDENKLKQNKTKKTPLSLKIDAELFKAINRECRRIGATRTRFIEVACRDALNSLNKTETKESKE